MGRQPWKASSTALPIARGLALPFARQCTRPCADYPATDVVMHKRLRFWYRTGNDAMERLLADKSCRCNRYMQGTFVLAIMIELKPGKKEAWLEKWGPLAAWVKENEPDTLAYETSEIEGFPNKLFVYERCDLLAFLFCGQSRFPFLIAGGCEVRFAR
jgi:hypothetical protein